MGNCCCEAESPCGSIEERSVLLKDDSKTSGAGDGSADGTCGPEAGEDMRRSEVEQPKEEVQVEQPKSLSKGRKTNNSQGNGHLQKEGLQQANASPREEESAAGEQRGDTAAERCTLTQLQEDASSPAGPEASGPGGEQKAGEDSSSAQEKVSDLVPPAPESARPAGSLSHLDTNTPAEDNAACSHAGPGEDGADARPPEESSQDNEVFSEPKPGAASIAAVSQETNTQAPSCSADSDVGSADTKSHALARPPASGSEPAEAGGAQEKPNPDGPEEKPDVASAAEAKDSDPDDEHGDSLCSLDRQEKTHPSGPAEDTGEETGTNVPEDEEEDDDGEKQETVEAGSPEAEAPTEIQEEPSCVKGDDEEDGDEDDSEEDLYRGEEELSASPGRHPGPTSDAESLKVQDSCSLSPAVDILSYSEREWKGNTAKSALIRKGYKEMSAKFGSVRRVRGDNYCALRATLFQVLSQSSQVPQWLQEDAVLLLPKQLEAQDGLISQWRFPGQSVPRDGAENPTERLKGYMELLRNTWRAAADCPGAAERQQLCERLFQGGEEELGMLEALKLLMLGRASELHGRMQAGEDVPLFCWLLFARDSSACPRSFLSNHLRHVGLSAGLEQVEMFLLGYALQHTIQVYRLYKANTEEFVTFYPDDHRDDWPTVSLVTEDDRHYNVPAAEASEELASS